MTENPIPKIFDFNRFTRLEQNVELAKNTKEEFEVLSELFIGNDLFEQVKIAQDVKLTKIIDMI